MAPLSYRDNHQIVFDARARMMNAQKLHFFFLIFFLDESSLKPFLLAISCRYSREVKLNKEIININGHPDARCTPPRQSPSRSPAKIYF